MIKLIKVNKYFNKNKANQIHAIDNTTLELGDKGLVTFLGNSGCGKTTLLNAIGGLDTVNSGEIYVDDQKITTRFSGKRDEIRNMNIGYIFQNYNLIEEATVFENVAVVLKMLGFKDRKDIEDRVMYVLKRMGIDKYRNRPAKMLSGGERQRVGIARAIVKNPKVIIADEPTGNLDSGNTIEIMNIIKAVSKEKLVILVTHEKDIAEFYSDRILHIVDGKVVSDEKNQHEGSLDYRIDNKIYMKDLPVQKEISEEGINLKLFSDSQDNVNITLVIKDSHIYLETDSLLSKGNDSVELVDDHYKELSKDVYEKYEFDYDKVFNKDLNVKMKYTSIYGPWKLIKDGFKRVHSYSRLKKLLLLGFVAASMFILYGISNIAGITNITDDKFMKVNKDYLTLSTGKVKLETFDKYKDMSGIRYALPGDSIVNFTHKMDDYYQSSNLVENLKASIAGVSLLSDKDIVKGTMPKDDYELAADEMLLNSWIKTGMAKQIGLDKPESFIGRKLILPDLREFTITAVVNTGSPCIYAKDSMMMPIIAYSADSAGADEKGKSQPQEKLMAYDMLKNQDDIELKRGTMPDELYEVALPIDRAGEVEIGSTINTKVNDHKLKVTGFFRDARNRNLMIVTDQTKEYSVFGKLKNITLAPKDKAKTLESLEKSDVRVIDNYQADRADYIKNIKDNLMITLIVAGIMLLISLIEIYLMLRASFLSRVKEVGVLRAIGLKKRDIYRMFTGEIIAITTLTAIPGMIFMYYILKGLVGIEFFQGMFIVNPGIVVFSLIIVLVFNLIAGLIPVFTTMRKTPAEILARNDVN